MDHRTASNHPAERKDDRHPLGPLNWEDAPTPEEMKATEVYLENLRQRVHHASHAMLEQFIKTTKVDPMRVILVQKFDLDGRMEMTAKILPEPEPRPLLATIEGKLVEVGNMDGDPDIGISLDAGDGQFLTIVGLTQKDARSIAQHYGDQIEIIVRAVPANGQQNG
jgi:hypothetical protein